MHTIHPLWLTTILFCAISAISSAIPYPERPAPAESPDDVIVDATFVACNDSTESLLILRDGRVVYALGTQATAFSVAEAMLIDLKNTMATCSSRVETSGLDSCTTLGVVLYGGRYVLINTAKPAKETLQLFKGIDRIRKVAERRLATTIERMTNRLDGEPDSAVYVLPTVSSEEIEQGAQISDVARAWKCQGSVFVVARVQHNGRVRQAFVNEVHVQGKCAALLCVSALRSVLLAHFNPATKKNGKAITTWIRVEVPFYSRR